jgi:fused signal recognition particle receptor
MILDGTQGNSAIAQAKAFNEMVGIDGIIVTKLDGTAKGGVVIGISDQFQIPVKYIGIGEGMEDLQVFNKTEFVSSLFS